MAQRRDHRVAQFVVRYAGLSPDVERVDRPRYEFVERRVGNFDVIGGAGVREEAGFEIVVHADHPKAHAVDAQDLAERLAAAEETPLERLAHERHVAGAAHVVEIDAPALVQRQGIEDDVFLACDQTDVIDAVGFDVVVPAVVRKDVAHDALVLGEHGRCVTVLNLRGVGIVLLGIDDDQITRIAEGV